MTTASGTRPFSLSAPGTWQLMVAKMQRIHLLKSGWCCFREIDPEVRWWWRWPACGLISDNKEWPWPGRARGGPPSGPATESCPGEVSAGGAGRGGRWALTRGGAAAVCCLHRRTLHTTFHFIKPFYKHSVPNVRILIIFKAGPVSACAIYSCSNLQQLHIASC